MDLVRRFVGEETPHRFLEPAKRGFFQRIFGAEEATTYAG
jgi:septum site-determining protein MinD